MNKFSTKTLCESALICALTVVLVLVGTYVPPVSMISVFICGLPLAYLMVRRGVKVTVLSLAVSIIILFAVTGNILSAAFTACMVLLPGTISGWSLGKNDSYYVSLFWTAAAVLLGVVLNVMLINSFSGSENGIADMIDSAIETMKTALNPLVEEAKNTTGTDVTDSINMLFSQTKTTILTYFPSFLIITSMIIGFLVLASTVFFLKRLRVKNCQYVPFNMIIVPRSMSMALILLMLVTMFSESTSTFMIVLKNAVAVLSFIMAIDGLSFVDFAVSKRIKNGYLRFVIYVAASLIGYFILSVIFYALMLIGILDSGRNFRRINR